jgi:hypothetical protein
MNDSSTLERRYRRLLALYPMRFRRQREEEMIAVLMAGAGEGQRWPRPAEVLNLTRHAAPSRLRQGPPPGSFARRHPRTLLTIRVLLGIWLLVLTIVLTRYSAWGLTVLLAEALNLYLLARAYVYLRDGGGDSGPRTPLEDQRDSVSSR